MSKIIPLGGLGEIGLNMMAIEFGPYILVVDAGLMFPHFLNCTNVFLFDDLDPG